MRWRLRASRSRPVPTVDYDVFDTAAKQLGFTLDDAQQRAGAALSTDRNLYLWGPVGRGKSWLMATYFAALPTDRKMRVHFHEFFRDLHLAIRRHRNDLAAALDDLLGGVDVVCFDEFHVHDPADGKFIARLLPSLLDRDIRIILTSNYPPHALLPNPLFHADFVPTIELIEEALTVVTVDGPADYRTISGHEDGFPAGWWITPDELNLLGLQEPTPDEHRTLAPAGHSIHVDRASDGCLWLDFADLCEKTTAPADYLALTEDFPRWTIGNIPDLRTAGREPAQRFANVVDVLYDRDVTVVFVSTTPFDALTGHARMPVDIDRILSRLGQLRRVEPAHTPGSEGSCA